jgi:hypothetical protein
MSKTITIGLKVEVRPFTVPNFVVPVRKGTHSRSEPEPAGIPLSEMDPTELADMCKAYVTEVFEKAGRKLTAVVIHT